MGGPTRTCAQLVGNFKLNLKVPSNFQGTRRPDSSMGILRPSAPVAPLAASGNLNLNFKLKLKCVTIVAGQGCNGALHR